MTTTETQMTPQAELTDLCDISVTAGVAIVSKISPGAEYFDDIDFGVLLESLRRTPDLTGVLFDGITSVHRPGILTDSVTFYNRSEEQMLEHLENVPRHEHVRWMFNELMKLQDDCYRKFREALPKLPIVHSIDSDDFHGLAERMLRVIVQSGKVKVAASKKSLKERHDELQKTLDGFGKLTVNDLQAKLHKLEERRGKQVQDGAKKRIALTDREIAAVNADMALIAKQQELETKRPVYKNAGDEARLETLDAELAEVKRAIDVKELGLTKALHTMTAERDMLRNVKGKQVERDALDADLKKCETQIAAAKARIIRLDAKMTELEVEFRDLREPETSPVYQRRVAEHVRRLYERFYKLGKKHDIRIVTKPELLVFGNLCFLYEHNTGRTWLPSPAGAKKLAESYHGLMDEIRKNVTARLKELNASVNDLDAVIVGGHDGAFMARWQRLHLTEEEIRMQHVNTFYTGGSDGVKHLLFLSCMPFEPQDKIAPYLKRQKPARTRGGIPINSANHPVFVRPFKRSVSGAQIVRKHQHGHLSVEAMMYDLYRTKAVLAPFKAVMSIDESDSHDNSPEMDILGKLGILALIDQLMEHPLELYGTKVYLGADYHLGDAGEGSTQSGWREAYKFRRMIMDAVREIPRDLVATDTADYEAVLRTTIVWANDMMGGANENLRQTAEVVSWFAKKKFLSIYHKSPARLRDMSAMLEGNHYWGANKGGGHREFDPHRDWLMDTADHSVDFPEDRCKPFPLKIMAGGEPQYFQPLTDKHEIVVHLGGYSVSRQAIIPEFGIGWNGGLFVQKPYRVGLTHEPNAIENKARSQRADVIKAGHTHEAYLAIDKTGDNRGRFIDQKGCTQRVSATELLYGGIPRTAGIDLCVYTQPERYQRLFIPMEHMRKVGLAWLRSEAEKAVLAHAPAAEERKSAAKKKREKRPLKRTPRRKA